MFKLVNQTMGFTPDKYLFDTYDDAINYLQEIFECDSKDTGLFNRMTKWKNDFNVDDPRINEDFCEFTHIWSIDNSETYEYDEIYEVIRCDKYGNVSINVR